MTAQQRYARIVGTGSYLPLRRVTNQALADQLAVRGIETSDEWIVTRTGIRARHFADSDVTTSALALAASQSAMIAAGIERQAIDLIIVATSTPDSVFPGTACLLQHQLGIHNSCAAFDIQAACTGFVYALTVADNMIRAGSCQTALVVGAETFSRLLDFNDRSTCVLFGDGAGAVILSAAAEPGILGSVLHADGRYAELLCVPGQFNGGVVAGRAVVEMDGPAIFKLAVNELDKVALEVLEKAALSSEQIDWLVPHQANIRIMHGLCRKLGLPLQRMVVTIDQHGNTSAASIPLVLDAAVRDGRIQRGHHILLEGIGGGLTWGAAVMRF
jgi:3-oxoacyl-[acyl-carrier-protein] synthase III